MISVIITVFNEENLIIHSLLSIFQQINCVSDFEIIVVASGCTDNTVDLIKYSKKKISNIVLIEEEKRNGKASALNIARDRVQGEICVLVDGDVILGKNSIVELLKIFKEQNVNLAGSRVVPRNFNDNIFTKIASIRCNIWHEYRLSQSKIGCPVIPSGYMYAIRTKFLPYVPMDIINDDHYIGLIQSEIPYTSAYSLNSLVYPIYPRTFDDYINQRLRTQIGRIQLEEGFDKQIQIHNKNFMNYSYKRILNTKFKNVSYAFLHLLLEKYIRKSAISIYNSKELKSYYVWDPIISTKAI